MMLLSVVAVRAFAVGVFDGFFCFEKSEITAGLAGLSFAPTAFFDLADFAGNFDLTIKYLL